MVEIGFKGHQNPVLGPIQMLGLGGVSFYLSFIGVGIVVLFWHLLCTIRRIFVTLLLV